MRTYKSIMSIPGILTEGEDYRTNFDLRNGSVAYKVVTVVYRAINLRCDSLSQVPVTLRKRGDAESEVEWPFPGVTPKMFLWKLEAGLMIHGAGFWLKRVNQLDETGRVVKDLQYLNPSTMEVKLVKGKLRFSQTLGDRNFGPWPQEQMVYLANFDPEQDILPGPSPVQVALGDAGLLHYMSAFSSQFFKNGAMPVTLVGLERPVSESEREKAERKLSQMISGVINAFRVRLLNSPVTPVKLTPDLDTLALDSLKEDARRSVSEAFGIPVTMLEDAANYATAGSHRNSFWQDTIRPHGEWIQEELNRQLFWPMNLELVLQWEEMDQFQEDEVARADSLTKLTGSGVPLGVALAILGYDLTKDQWGKIEQAEKDKKEVAQSLTNANNNANPPQEPPPGKESQEKSWGNWPPLPGTQEQAREELVKYQRKSLDSMSRGRSPAVVWNSEYLPDAVKGYIHLGLAGALTEEEVRAVFNAAFGWVRYGSR